MARSQRKYDHEYKVQAVKLAKEIGGAKAAKELGMILSILVYTFFSRMFDLMLPPVAKHSIVVA